ncbi:MAG: hypothetical protein ACTSSP_10160 [Candidatus Asgardarchaeia archaeon]
MRQYPPPKKLNTAISLIHLNGTLGLYVSHPIKDKYVTEVTSIASMIKYGSIGLSNLSFFHKFVYCFFSQVMWILGLEPIAYLSIIGHFQIFYQI